MAAGNKAVGLQVCLWAVPEQQETGCRPLLVQTGAGLPEETLGKEAALVSASRVVITNGSRKRNDLSSLMTDKAGQGRRWILGQRHQLVRSVHPQEVDKTPTCGKGHSSPGMDCKAVLQRRPRRYQNLSSRPGPSCQRGELS